MSFPDDLSIERLARGVIDRTLPKSDWTHAAHFAAALWLLRHRREMAGAAGMKQLIIAYNDATGTANTDTGGYHHTITRASMRAAQDHLIRLGSETPLHDALRALMASDLGRPDWLLAYWQRDTLFSVRARRKWVAPDKAPLPF
jgi:hypothetical protein